MSNLLASLTSAAQSMKAFETALSVVENNVVNASTPGYARQHVDLVALAFQPDLELSGGVDAGTPISTRDDYTERAVRQRAATYGELAQLAAGLSQVEPVFDVTEGSGIAGSLSDLYSAFSRLAVTPNDVTARENVIGRARDVARTFNFTAESLAEVREQTRREARAVVQAINQVAENIRELNISIRSDYRTQSDAGINARVYAALEELAGLVDFNALHQPDGSVTVLLGGQVPLVIGDRSFPISADVSAADLQILDYEGNRVGGKLTSGRLGGLLDVANDKVPSYFADLDRLAQSFADRVNGILAVGVDRNGLPPAVDLFTYDIAFGAAATLAVTGITADEIAAASAAAPGGNVNALDLAGLASAPEVDGLTFTEFYGNASARVGRDLAAARGDERSQELLLSQARTLRDEASGVNLDEEAARLLEYQRGYNAAAQMISILNELTDEVFRILR